MQMTADTDRLYRQANLLALTTIGYNLLEGALSVWLGAGDETLALFGFGLDSFVEVVSGIGVWHMVRRLRRSPGGNRDRFEQRALRITGGAFYLLTVGLAATAVLNLIRGHRPDTTRWGIVVALVSICTMWLLIRCKETVGKRLDSPAIMADAACTRACLYLSVVLLLASAGFALTGIGLFDSIGTLAIAWFALKEGNEAFGKARGLACSCSCSCSGT
jgi:divalent metal cation (Fe/Co/Zn/Cd) transporter